MYKLKPVVGFDDHCHSKLRNPAYTILGKRPAFELSQDGPGPIYLPKFPPTDGFSFGIPLPPISKFNYLMLNLLNKNLKN